MINDKAKEFLTENLKVCHLHMRGPLALIKRGPAGELARVHLIASGRAAAFLDEEIRCNGTMRVTYFKRNLVGNDALPALYEIVRDQLYFNYDENEQKFIEATLKKLDENMELAM